MSTETSCMNGVVMQRITNPASHVHSPPPLPHSERSANKGKND